MLFFHEAVHTQLHENIPALLKEEEEEEEELFIVMILVRIFTTFTSVVL